MRLAGLIAAGLASAKGRFGSRSALGFAPRLAAEIEQLPPDAGPGEMRVDLRILLRLQPLADVIDRRAVAGSGKLKGALKSVKLHFSGRPPGPL